MRTRFALTVGLIALGLVVWGGAPALADVISVPTPFRSLAAADGDGDNTLYTVTGDLLITSAGSITCNDNATDQPPGPIGTGASACEIKIVVTGNLLMEAGSAITADNNVDGGNAGNITITVGTDMTMCGPSGGQPGCAATGIPGALISAQKKSGGATSVVNSVTITVGDKATATGNFYMEGGVTTYGLETGATIDTTSTTGHAGNITITAGKTYFTEPGSVVQAGAPLGGVTATAQGGKIFLVADCKLTSQGRVTSKGPDFGADLVHLESCEVLVEGLVESTGKGHAANAPNSCDLVDDGLPGEVLRDHPAASTGCVEVWGNFIKIDSTPPWAGELNADIGDGGPAGTSWIDIFAFSDLTVIDGTGNDFERDNFGHTYFSTYAVHANAVDGSDNNPSVVTAKVKSGPLTAGSDGTAGGGRAFEASSTMTNDTGHGTHGLPNDPDPFEGDGSDGGTIDLEASGLVTLDTAWVNASGAFDSGTPPNGGHIVVSAWGTGSNLLWRNGVGDVRPIASGTIDLNACGLIIDTTGTEFYLAVPTLTHTCDATKPDIPVITAANAGPVFKQDLWALCGSSSVSGIKFNDLDGNHVRNGAEPVLPGWEIKIWNAAQTVLVNTATTDGSGAYSFAVPASSYVVCETLQAGWTQTAPVAGVGVVDCTNGTKGYTVDLTSGGKCTGQQIIGKDFGNIQQATKSGMKFNDLNGDHVHDAGEPGLDGWVIHLFGTAVDGSAVHQTYTTAGGGNYTFTVLPGTYTVCEALQATWTQTYPTSGANCIVPGDPALDNPTPGAIGYSIVLAGGDNDTGNDFGNWQPFASKSGMKFNDLNGDHIHDAGEPGLSGWGITLWNATQTVVVATATTGGSGAYSFPNLAPGSYVVCETPQAGWTQTFPIAGVLCTNGTIGYAFTLLPGQNETGNDFGNWKPIVCPEDPGRAAQLTRTVNLSLPNLSGSGVAGDPKNYWLVQEAYNAAKLAAQAEVIGLFANTSENLVLDGSKSLTITQCTVARVTGGAGSPVWDITSTGKLTIIGPDSVGGSIGWRVAGNGGHNLKSIRANGAGQYGVQIVSNSNSVSWNDVSGNGVGIRVTGGSNTLKGGTVASNNGDGVQLIGSSNNLSGSTIQSNTGNGVLVAGSGNTVKSNSRINRNGQNGILVTGSGNTLSSNASESGKGNTQSGIAVSGNTNQLTDNKMYSNAVGFGISGTGNKLKSNAASNNSGNEYTIGINNVDQGGNKKNGSSFTFTSAGGNFN